MKEVKDEAEKIFNKLKAYTKKQHSFSRNIDVKISSMYYCNMMSHSEPHRKEYWGKVSKYIDERF